MSTQRIRLPERLVEHIIRSDDWTMWRDGRGVLPTDRVLFMDVASADRRPDGSIHLDADPGLRATIHQWAIRLSQCKGYGLDDKRANVRSARSVIRQINPKAQF